MRYVVLCAAMMGCGGQAIPAFQGVRLSGELPVVVSSDSPTEDIAIKAVHGRTGNWIVDAQDTSVALMIDIDASTHPVTFKGIVGAEGVQCVDMDGRGDANVDGEQWNISGTVGCAGHSWKMTGNGVFSTSN